MKKTCFSTKFILLIFLAIVGFGLIFKKDLGKVVDRDTRCQ